MLVGLRLHALPWHYYYYYYYLLLLLLLPLLLLPSSTQLQRLIHNFRDWCCHLVKKTNSGPASHHHPRSSPLEVEFCEGDQHRLRSAQLCLLEVFQFYLQLGKQREAGRVGDDSHVVIGQSFPGKKEV
jgi:hypothetical protein